VLQAILHVEVYICRNSFSNREVDAWCDRMASLKFKYFIEVSFKKKKIFMDDFCNILVQLKLVGSQWTKCSCSNVQTLFYLPQNRELLDSIPFIFISKNEWNKVDVFDSNFKWNTLTFLWSIFAWREYTHIELYVTIFFLKISWNHNRANGHSL